MAKPDLIVVGASAGGVEAIQSLAAGLPADLRAAVCIVLHIGNGLNLLPEILGRAGPLPAREVVDGDEILGAHGSREENGRPGQRRVTFRPGSFLEPPAGLEPAAG